MWASLRMPRSPMMSSGTVASSVTYSLRVPARVASASSSRRLMSRSRRRLEQDAGRYGGRHRAARSPAPPRPCPQVRAPELVHQGPHRLARRGGHEVELTSLGPPAELPVLPCPHIAGLTRPPRVVEPVATKKSQLRSNQSSCLAGFRLAHFGPSIGRADGGAARRRRIRSRRPSARRLGTDHGTCCWTSTTRSSRPGLANGTSLAAVRPSDGRGSDGC